MRRTISSVFSGFLTASIASFPTSSGAVFPVAMLGKEILQNVIFGQVKNQLIGSLANMGCKGARLAGVIASASAGKNFGGGGMPGGMPPGIPGGGIGIPGGEGLPPTGHASIRAARGGVGIPEVSQAQAEAMMRSGTPDMATMMSQMPGMSPEQAAQMQKSLASMQEAMSHPLSRAETLDVFDELASLGLLTNEMRGEVRDCIELAPLGSDSAIGTTGAIMKSSVLPALRDAKLRLNSLTPEEQNQLADGLVDALKQASPKDRQVFLNGFGAGFYPAPVVETVRARMVKH